MHSLLLCCLLSRSVLVSGTIADYLSTRRALQLGAQEANPIVRVIGPGKVMTASSAAIELLLHYSGTQEEFPRAAAALRIAGGALHFGAAAWNLHEIHQMRKTK